MNGKKRKELALKTDVELQELIDSTEATLTANNFGRFANRNIKRAIVKLNQAASDEKQIRILADYRQGQTNTFTQG
jgi:hypothetical protein